jgi:hypothetical protein
LLLLEAAAAGKAISLFIILVVAVAREGFWLLLRSWLMEGHI